LNLGELRYTAAGAATVVPRFLAGRDNPLRGPGFVIYPAAARPIHENNQG
jgi:hypothetical protein